VLHLCNLTCGSPLKRLEYSIRANVAQPAREAPRPYRAMRNPPVIGPSDGDRENVGGPGDELPSVTGLSGVRSFAGSDINRASV
jgi:hypothetical protein